MEELSGFTYLLGRPTLAELEMDAAIDHLNSDSIEGEDYLPLLGSSFAYAFGRNVTFGIRNADGTDATSRVREQIGEEAYAGLVEKANHHLEQAMLRGPSDEDIPKLRARGFDAERLRASTDSRLGFEHETQQLLTDAPEWRRGRLRDFVSAREITHEWIDIYVRHLQERELRGMPHELLSAETQPGFWAAMPHVQVAISVKAHYHRDPARRWSINDVSDIDAMAIAYAYCDVLFTDRAARAAIADSRDLRTIRTFMPRRPEQLAEWLKTLPAMGDPDRLVPHPWRQGA